MGSGKHWLLLQVLVAVAARCVWGRSRLDVRVLLRVSRSWTRCCMCLQRCRPCSTDSRLLQTAASSGSQYSISNRVAGLPMVRVTLAAVVACMTRYWQLHSTSVRSYCLAWLLRK